MTKIIAQLVLSRAAAAILAAAAFASSAGAADLSHGEKLWRKCVSCHTLEPDGRNKVGPRLYGLFGRAAGSVPDYLYTDELKASGIVWNEKTLDAFLHDSEAMVPGTKMYGGLSQAEDRSDLIAFLKQATTGAASSGSGR
ncbi:MAG: cytochrome c family protein [Rhodospirillales bacterium]|nr:cytochrome c family protein [Rhodospirillales bacterium]